jgi:hypothetical protein
MASTITDRIDGVTASLAVKTPVKAATTAAIALEGEQAIDGVSVTAGDRVLVKDQANPVENGIYNANTGAWTRARDFDGARDAVTGTLVVVASGDTSAGYWYQLATADPVIIGTSAISFIPVPPTHGLARVSEVVLFSDGTDWFVETPDGVPVDISSSTTGGIQEAFDYARDNGFGLHVTKGPTITMTGTLTLQSFEHMTVRIDANITSAAQYGIVFDDFLHSFIEFTGVFMFSGSAGAAIHIAPSTGNKNALDSSIYFQRVLATGGSGSVGLLFSPLDAASCQRTKYAFGEMEGGAGTTAYWANLVKVLNPTNGGVFRSNRVEFVGPGLIWSSAALQVVDSDSPSSLQYNYWSGAFFTSASATAFIDTRETGGQYRCDLVSSSAGVTTGIKTRIGANDNVFQFQMNIAATPVDFSVTGSAVGNLVIGPPCRAPRVSTSELRFH